jgi:hypothetical protein
MRCLAALSLLALVAGGCPSQGLQGPNAFLTLAEQFGAASLGFEDQDVGGGTLDDVDIPFRQPMSLTLSNRSGSQLNLSFAAWVRPESISSREQEDALFEGGYNRLDAEVRLGTAYLLPVGTFVLDNGGAAGAKNVRIEPAAGADDFDADENGANDQVETFITPDVLLIFQSPPESCESVAFSFTKGGLPVDDVPISGSSEIFAGATGVGGLKTLGQFDVYQCDPFRPGLFFKSGGGARQGNEFFEGQSVQVQFARAGFAGSQAYAIVTIQ